MDTTDILDATNSLISHCFNKHFHDLALSQTEDAIILSGVEILPSKFYEGGQHIYNEYDEYIPQIIDNLIKNKFYIIKIIFSNNSFIYVSKDVLCKIEYFSTLLSDCDTSSDDLIIELHVNKFIDNFNCLGIIIEFIDYEKYTQLYYYNIDDFINLLSIVDFLLGQIECNNKNFVECISEQFFDDTIINTNILIPIKTIGDILMIFNRQKIPNITAKIIGWIVLKENHFFDIYDFDDIFNSDVFSIISGTYHGKNLVIKYTYFPFFEKIIDDNNCEKLIDILLSLKPKNMWEIICKLSNIYIENVSNALIKFIDNITEDIFDVDLSVFTNDFRLNLIIKFKRPDKLKILEFHKLNHHKLNECLKFMMYTDPSNTDYISPLKNSVIIFDKIYKKSNHFVEMFDFPNNYRWWSKFSEIASFYEKDGNIEGICINVSLLYPFQKINLRTPILINGTEGDPFNIATIQSIFYDNNGQLYERDEIMSYKQSIPRKYVLILDKDILKNIKVSDFVYMT